MIRTNKDLSSENKIIYVYFLSSARKASLTLHSALCPLPSKKQQPTEHGWLLFFIPRRRPENSDHCV